MLIGILRRTVTCLDDSHRADQPLKIAGAPTRASSVRIYRLTTIKVSPMTASPTDVDFTEHGLPISAAERIGASPGPRTRSCRDGGEGAQPLAVAQMEQLDVPPVEPRTGR